MAITVSSPPSSPAPAAHAMEPQLDISAITPESFGITILHAEYSSATKWCQSQNVLLSKGMAHPSLLGDLMSMLAKGNRTERNTAQHIINAMHVVAPLLPAFATEDPFAAVGKVNTNVGKIAQIARAHNCPLPIIRQFRFHYSLDVGLRHEEFDTDSTPVYGRRSTAWLILLYRAVFNWDTLLSREDRHGTKKGMAGVTAASKETSMTISELLPSLYLKPRDLVGRAKASAWSTVLGGQVKVLRAERMHDEKKGPTADEMQVAQLLLANAETPVERLALCTHRAFQPLGYERRQDLVMREFLKSAVGAGRG